MRLGFIGCGTIADAVVRALVGQGHQIVVSERSARISGALAQAFADVSVADNQSVLEQSDVIFLGLIAENAAAILSELRFGAHHRVVSFMADAALEQVAAMVAPAKAEAIMLPFPAIATGGSPILALGQEALLSDLFAPRDRLFFLPNQEELAAYLAAQAVLSPVALMVAEAADWLGQNSSDVAQGEAFLRHLVTCSLAAMPGADLVQSLNTPGGFNQRLRVHMEEAGLKPALAEGLTRLKQR